MRINIRDGSIWNAWLSSGQMVRMGGYLFAIAACVVLLAALEMFARWYRPTPPLPNFHEIGWNAKRSPYRLVATVDPSYARDTAAEINQLVLRGRPFTRDAGGKIRVLLVGDSQVEAAAQPFSDIPEILLEQILDRELGGRGFEVRSIGVGGWGQAQQLVALRQYFAEYKADYVLLWHTQGNDFWENAFADRSTSTQVGLLKPTFVLGPSGLAEFDFEPYKRDTPGFLGQFDLYRRAYRIAERVGLIGEARLTRDYNKLIPSPAGHKTAPREKCPATVVDQFAYSASRGAYGFTPVSIETAEAFLESRSHFSPFLKEMSERDKYLVNVTRALMREIGLLAKANGSELIVFFSNQSYRDGTHRFIKGSCVGQSGNWYELVDTAERVREVLADLHPIELEAAHSDVPFDEVTISRWDRHLNRRGNELVFGELAKVLAQKGLMSPAPSCN